MCRTIFLFPTCKNSQKRAKNQKSTDKYSSFDGLLQEDIDQFYIFLPVNTVNTFLHGPLKIIKTSNLSFETPQLLSTAQQR